MSPKKIRITISTIIFILFLVIFIFPDNFAAIFLVITKIQFFPALFKMIFSFGLVSSFFFLFILSITLIFGRFYCASLCPLGIFQDIISYISGKIKKRKRLNISFPTINFIIFIITFVSLILGTMAVVDMLDPYSIFGRIAVNLFKPVVIGINNLLVNILEYFDIYALSYINLHVIPTTLLFSTILFFILVTVLPAIWGRFYCNTICPVGAFLGILSRFSYLKIQIAADQCTKCMKCSKACPAGCIDIDHLRIEHSQCLICFDCISVCPQSIITYMPKQKSYAQTKTDRKKREMIKHAAGLSLLAAGYPLSNITKKFFHYDEMQFILPPGSQNVEYFTSLCTSCHLCVSTCPERIITPSPSLFGLKGRMQPVIDFSDGYCAYDCNKCGEVCPSNAIKSLPLEEKQITKMGNVRLKKGRCVVWIKDTNCGACAELCPTHACYTVEKNRVFYPMINQDLCIGCGACEFACPENPKAIFVNAIPNQEIAIRPFSDQDNDKTRKKEESSGEFPF